MRTRLKHLAGGALLLSLVVFSNISYRSATDGEDLKINAMLACKVGDSITVTVDNKPCNWSSYGDSVAVIKDEKIVIEAAGDYIVKNDDGFAVKLKAQGSGGSNDVSVNFDSEVEVNDAVIEDNTSTVKTVEVNETLNASVNSIPEGFTLDENQQLKAGSEGTYLLEDSSGKVIVNVISPELNTYSIDGITGTKNELDLKTEGIEVVSVSSSNEEVATIDSNGVVTLMNEGSCEVYLETPNNKLTCKVTSKNPTIDEGEVTLKEDPYSYQIEVHNNDANLPVKYEVEEGKGKVSDTGLVTMEAGNECTVKVTIWDKIVYRKKFKAESVNKGYWGAMQPYIKRCLGTPYVMGGNTPGVALDCSAYCSYVYRMVGLVDGRYTAQGLYDMCQKTTNPQPGDLVFFTGTYNAGCYITHVGIYAGDGMMYHSGTPNQLQSYETSYYKSHLVGFGTMINSSKTPKKAGSGTVSQSQAVSASSSDIDLLAAIIQCEAGSTNYEGCLAVGSCIVNRINSPLYPNTVRAVVYQSGQFSPTWEGKLDRVLASGAGEIPYQAARDALAGKNNIGRCLQFRSASTGRQGKNIGGNVFFDER